MFVLRSRDDEKERDKVREKHKDKIRDRDRDRPRKGGRSRKKSPSTIDRYSPSSTTSIRQMKRDMTSDFDRQVKTGSSPSPSPSPTKPSLPYPSFSKAHSKESVARDFTTPDAFTPDPTDVGREDKENNVGKKGKEVKEGGEVEDGKEAKEGKEKRRVHKTTLDRDAPKTEHQAGLGGGPPPSPPLTATTQPTKSFHKSSKTVGHESRRSFEGTSSRKVDDRPQSWISKLASGRKSADGPFRTSSYASTKSGSGTAMKSKSTAHKRDRSPTQRREASSDISRDSRGTNSTADSDATSVAPGQPPFASARSPQEELEATPSTPRMGTPLQAIAHAATYNSPGIEEARSPPVGLPMGSMFSPQPPPPPPPPTLPVIIPRVDYLLHNGGLPHNVPRALLAATQPIPSHPAQPQHQYAPQRTPAPNSNLDQIFAPYHRMLDEYQTVLSRSGSIAVATGYKSVARRLLDRLENVFARDISSETCSCLMCQSRQPTQPGDPALSWGEILEWVSGRRNVPTWPAFDFGQLGESSITADGLKISGITSRAEAPNIPPPDSPPIDVDVPEEYRDHYLRQSKKTKQTVDQWLTSQPSNPSSPPPEVDDETLTFTILTHLDRSERSIFTALLSTSGSTLPPGSRAPTPLKPRSDLLVRTGIALQRLYRLPTIPRDPESAIFLLRHPDLHTLLATLATIHSAEWDVLTSGRFDGFLWSGADDPSASTSPQITRNATPLNRGHGSVSRNTTPFSTGGGNPVRTSTPFHLLATAASRGTTPAPGPPVPHDEETEIAVLAEVEREIYVGMEALEDAFEALHRKAESVRRALRERGAGLSVAGQARRNQLGLNDTDVEAVRGTPGAGSTPGGGVEWESESEGGWGLGGDGGSEVWPDDSASNVSSSRVRRPKRRNERRTPALVEEDDENVG